MTDARVREAEAKVQAALAECERLKDQIWGKVTSSLTSWAESTAATVAGDQPVITQGLKETGQIGDLKRRIASGAGATAGAVSSALVSAPWPHHNPQGARYVDFEIRTELHELVEHAVQPAVEQLRTQLQTVGFEITAPPYGSSHHPGAVRQLVSYESPLDGLDQSYAKAVAALRELATEEQRVRDLVAREAARDVWDEG